VIPGLGGPDLRTAARDQLARRAEAGNPGWEISHHLYGWTRTRDQRTETAVPLPGLMALIGVAGPARPPPGPRRFPPWQRGPGTTRRGPAAGGFPGQNTRSGDPDD
jgi:hypothetical protein